MRKGVRATFCSKTGQFFLAVQNHSGPKSAPRGRGQFCSKDLGSKNGPSSARVSATFGVRVTFCSKPFLVAALNSSGPGLCPCRPGASDRKMRPRVLVCAERSRGHVLQQKQGRSSCMAVLNHSGSRVLTPAQERKQITFSSYLEVKWLLWNIITAIYR